MISFRHVITILTGEESGYTIPPCPPLTEDLKGGEEGDGSIYIGFFPYTVYTIEEPFWIFIIYDKIFELIFIQILSILIFSHLY